VAPRRLSFTNVYTLVETFLPQLNSARTPQQWDACWQRIIVYRYFLPFAQSIQAAILSARDLA
jgi:hypothetical protein